MPLRLTRGATALALAVSLGLVALPACKKSKRTEADTNNPNDPNAPNQPGDNSGRPADAPRSPVFASGEALMRPGSRNNMMQIMLALHNYNDTYGALPVGIADKSGKPGLSWRVAILPFIEYDGLYKQFKLNEPWDSEHNKKLIPQMPKIYAPPRTDTNGYTFYRGFTGPGTWMTPRTARPAQAGQPILGVRLTDITDGTANTILVAEAYDPVIWTKPDELPFTPGTAPRLGGVFASGIHVGMGDGSVRFLKKGIEPQVIASAIQINDGGIVNLDE